MRIFLEDLEYTFGSSEPLESFLVKGVCSESCFFFPVASGGSQDFCWMSSVLPDLSWYWAFRSVISGKVEDP